MIFNSAPLLAVIIVDMIALLMYNFSGMCVTGEQPLSPIRQHISHMAAVCVSWIWHFLIVGSDTCNQAVGLMGSRRCWLRCVHWL